MANAAYPLGLQAILEGAVDVTDGSLSVQALDSSETFSTLDEFFDDIGGGARLGSPQICPDVTDTAGLITHTVVTFDDIPDAETIAGFVYFMDTTVEGTSRLLAWIDTSHAGAAISFATDGSSITWDMPDGVLQI